MAYDSTHQRAMLFGGLTAQALQSDTWQYEMGTWRRLLVGAAPPARENHGMVYDAQREQLMLFGGESSTYLGDTWVFDGVTWTQKLPATSPPPRIYPVMAYHAVRGETLMFGGFKDGALGDTWVWNGTTWTQQSGAAPPASAVGVMAYDSVRMEIVYYGSSQTWTWNGTWTQESPANPPQYPFFDVAAFSPTNSGEVVVFSPFGGTYTWDGTNWTVREPTAEPAASDGAAMAFESSGAILFGGYDQQSPAGVLAETWMWSGTNWEPVPADQASPPARRGHAMTYSMRRGEIIMFLAREP